MTRRRRSPLARRPSPLATLPATESLRADAWRLGLQDGRDGRPANVDQGIPGGFYAIYLAGHKQGTRERKD